MSLRQRRDLLPTYTHSNCKGKMSLFASLRTHVPDGDHWKGGEPAKVRAMGILGGTAHCVKGEKRLCSFSPVQEVALSGIPLLFAIVSAIALQIDNVKRGQ
jgi:hypothetical protein